MITLCGKGVYGGIAIGRLSFFQRAESEVEKRRIANPDDELLRYDRARTKAKNELRRLYDATCREIDEESASIFEIHEMMLDDEDYNEKIKQTISAERASAEYAVQNAGLAFAAEIHSDKG